MVKNRLATAQRIAVWLATALLLVVVTLVAIKTELDGGYAIHQIRVIRREFTDTRLAASLSEVPCPQSALTIVALGQSNAANHVGGPVARNTALPAYAFFRDRCVRIQDPLPGATGNQGSLWTALAHQLARSRNEPVVIIAAAVAGASVSDWHDDRGRIMMQALRSIKGAAEKGLRPDLIVWLQGEADSEDQTPQNVYETLLQQVIVRVDTHIGNSPAPGNALAPWIITNTSICFGKESHSEAIREAQRTVVSSLQHAHLGPDTDLLGESYRSDGCHFNARGRRRLVDELLPMINAAIAQ